MGNYVLVVDDNSSDRKLAKLVIEKEGFVTVMAEDAHMAIDKLSDCDYALFVVDIQMPLMSGLDLVKRLKRIDSVKNIPILIMSGRNSPDDVKKAIQLGACDYVIKPIDLAVFSDKVSQLLKNKKTEWQEYDVTTLEDASTFVHEPCEIISINEVGATMKYPPGINIASAQTKVMGGAIFEKNGIENVMARCYSVRPLEDGTKIVKVSFVGLEDEQRRKLRLYCRSLWNEQKKAV